MQYVLGVDQGHTQTRAAICDSSGRILGTGSADGACHSRHGMDRAMATVRDASEAALRQAGIRARDLTVMFCGLTGADWPDEYQSLPQNLMRLGLCHNIVVKNDSIIALRGGTSADFGAIVIAGTGGNCAIRSPSGQEFIYHFYHDLDLQGGTALGRRALNAIYRVETGREPPTALKARVLELLGFGTVDALLRADVEADFGLEEMKDIAPLVFEAACQADTVACNILQAFGEGLAELVTAGLKRLEMTHLDVEVVLSGSVFKGPGSLVQEVMIAHIHMTAPRATLVNARYEPLVGAVVLGLEQVGVEVGPRIKANIERSSKELGLIRLCEQSFIEIRSPGLT